MTIIEQQELQIVDETEYTVYATSINEQLGLQVGHVSFHNTAYCSKHLINFRIEQEEEKVYNRNKLTFSKTPLPKKKKKDGFQDIHKLVLQD